MLVRLVATATIDIRYTTDIRSQTLSAYLVSLSACQPVSRPALFCADTSAQFIDI